MSHNHSAQGAVAGYNTSELADGSAKLILPRTGFLGSHCSRRTLLNLRLHKLLDTEFEICLPKI